MIAIPRIALVGRPNVGKSTLFNRICGVRKAITDGRPGSTRDRNYAYGSWQGAGFELVDTGGLLLQTDDPLLGPAAEQAQRAIDESDLVLLLVDGRAGLMPDDAQIAARLRRLGKEVVLVVNKVERSDSQEFEFERLGFTHMATISAEHGLGIGDLLDIAVGLLPRVELPEQETETTRLALVGRPNVGKSSLLNQLVGDDRAVVSAVPGTTRDAVDSLITRAGRHYLFVDTAGIRRSRALKEAVDHVSVVQAKRSIERAHVGIVVVDASEGFRELDATIAGYVHESGRAVVVAVNKWDLAKGLSLTQRPFEEELRYNLKFLSYAPVVMVSAQTGSGLGRLLRTVDRVRASALQRVSTGALNRVIARAAKKLTPQGAKGAGQINILFAKQTGVAPPTFVISTNRRGDLHFSYKRYLENQLRAEFGFEGTPITLRVRKRSH